MMFHVSSHIILLLTVRIALLLVLERQLLLHSWIIFPHSLENLNDRQTRLESEMVKLTVKVDAMDVKLDQILSLLLSSHGHDAKKGEENSQILMIMIILMMLEPKSSRGQDNQKQPLMLLNHFHSSQLMLLVHHKQLLILKQVEEG